MNEIQVFNSPEFGEIRTVEIDGKPYFVANDIAKSLGYIETAKAIRTHCKGVSEMDIPSNGGVQRMKVIPEGDIYRLIIRSKLPSAEKFEMWVFDEVLPAIRNGVLRIFYRTFQNDTKQIRTLQNNINDGAYLKVHPHIMQTFTSRKVVTFFATLHLRNAYIC